MRNKKRLSFVFGLLVVGLYGCFNISSNGNQNCYTSTGCNTVELTLNVNPIDTLIVRAILDSNGLFNIGTRQICRGNSLNNGRLYDITIAGLRVDSFYFPTIANQLTTLQSLIMIGNNLTGVPRNISLLRNLKYLSLSRNMIGNLPDELFSLNQLIEFGVENNLLDSISSKIGNIPSLANIFIANNLITSLPIEITRLPKFLDNRIVDKGIWASGNHICNPSSELDAFMNLYSRPADSLNWKQTQICP